MDQREEHRNLLPARDAAHQQKYEEAESERVEKVISYQKKGKKGPV